MRPRNGAQVSTSGSDDRIHVIAFENISHRDRGNTDVIGYLVRKRYLEHPSVYWPLCFAHLPRGAVNHVGSYLFEKARDSGCVVRRCTARHPIMRGNAHAHRFVLRPHSTHVGEDLKRIAAAILETPPVLIWRLFPPRPIKPGPHQPLAPIQPPPSPT